MKTRLIGLFAALFFGAMLQAQPVQRSPDSDVMVIGGMESTPKSQQRIAQRRKAVARITPVDINSATEKQLKKLPGIDDALAKRIIANRPYGSKLWLVTNGVLGEGPYLNIKHLIIARQPYKTVEENAARYEKLRQESKVKP